MVKSSLVMAGLVPLALSTGCYHLTIHNGRSPTSEPAPGYEGKWRSAVILDAVEVDKPLPLDLLCKGSGWAEIDQTMGPLNWLVDVFLAGFVYESSTLTLRCAKSGVLPNPPIPQKPAAPPSAPQAPPVPL